MSKISPIELQKALSGIDYPCKRDDLVRTARNNGAGEEVIAALEQLSDATFDGPDDVSKAVF